MPINRSIETGELNARFASFVGVDNRVLPERYWRAPVTRARTGNGTARHKPEYVPHRSARFVPGPSGPEVW